ncbi:hypothetical protein [Solidesulfovibrio sp.]|uniref:hypothetical protein n=1 Tax=Solidesulfovibrio sp. TaxID=2910990 RepID=UPI002B20115B|nr:hypothetical protein [Solidesulfovibrio sp.]MEA5090611.1 hypothetical protein [Solidesulfovibrio sp.]
MIASFLGTNAFAVTGDRTAEFSPGVRVLADCGADGARYGTAAAALYAADTDRTTVTLALDTGGLTAALAAVLHGNDVPASLVNHGHAGPADGGAVAHGALVGVGTNSHAAIDAFLASKAAASGLASLDAASRVVQDPASATATPGATKLVMSDAAGTVDAWVSDATTGGKGKVRLATIAEMQAGVCADKAVTPAGLAGAAKGLIAADTTLHVATTGSDATGDGSPDAPFASISRALASIRNRLIASGATVTIQVADGTYTISSAIVIDHPDADKIQILGNTSPETSVAIASIDMGAKTITVAGDYTASLQGGDIIGLTGSSTSGLNGAYVVSDVAYAGGNTVVTVRAETIASDTVGGGNIVIKPCNKCDIVFLENVYGFIFYKPNKAISGFRIESKGGTAYGIMAMSGSIVTVNQNNIIYNFAYGIYAVRNSYVYYDNICVKNSTWAFYAGSAKITPSSNCVVLDSIYFGAMAQDSGFVALPSGRVVRANVALATPASGEFGNNGSYVVAY